MNRTPTVVIRRDVDLANIITKRCKSIQQIKDVMLDAQDQLGIVVRDLFRHYPLNFVIEVMGQVSNTGQSIADVFKYMTEINDVMLSRARAYVPFCMSLRDTVNRFTWTQNDFTVTDIKVATAMFNSIFYNNINDYIDKMVEYAYDNEAQFKDAICLAWAHACPIVQQPYTHIHRLRIERQQYHVPKLLTDIRDTHKEYVSFASEEELHELNNMLSTLTAVAHTLYDNIKANPLYIESRLVRNDMSMSQIDITQYFYKLSSKPIERALSVTGGIDDYIVGDDRTVALRADVRSENIDQSPTAGSVCTTTNFDHYAELNQLATDENKLIDLLKQYIYTLKFVTSYKCARCNKNTVASIQSGADGELTFCSVECATAFKKT
ncbi:hypothetical protein [Scale drop disease virus]|uniref:ORF_032L n=1 Tax=Scale drop disease virus TaxID=1697349 RepID=A0A0K1L657_9VIRU|nr:ORF_032L [Scale drop disease virus]AKU37447.1 ORF_032L [Scale drop disease virus]QLI60705.1 hypothetical protein [Scale drop disease virus]QXJ13623.1 ORF032L [Scale drop disease virus]UNH60750.1 hypothetical protein SDDV_ORF081 [Scale drop disease virus]